MSWYVQNLSNLHLNLSTISKEVSKKERKTINVSENDDVTSQAQQHSHGKQRLKRCVLRRLQKTGSDCADVTCCGRLFQTRAAATGKARSPTVDNRVWRMTIAMTMRRNVVDIVPRNPPAHEVRQQGKTVLLPADTCRQGEQACSQSSSPFNQWSSWRSRVMGLYIPRRWENQPGSGDHYRLETIGLVQRNTGKGCISVIQSWQNKWQY